MHIIRDIQTFLKKIEETISNHFGKDEAGVVGYAAIKEVINESISEITSETSTEIKTPKVKKGKSEAA